MEWTVATPRFRTPIKLSWLWPLVEKEGRKMRRPRCGRGSDRSQCAHQPRRRGRAGARRTQHISRRRGLPGTWLSFSGKRPIRRRRQQQRSWVWREWAKRICCAELVMDSTPVGRDTIKGTGSQAAPLFPRPRSWFLSRKKDRPLVRFTSALVRVGFHWSEAQSP